MAGHRLRQGEIAGVGEGGREGPDAALRVTAEHDDVLHHAGDDLQNGVILQAHAAREHGLQLLRRGVQPQLAADKVDELGERIFAERGVGKNGHGHDEVAQRLRGEILPQIDGYAEGDGLLPPRRLAPLLFQQQVQQHRGQILRDGAAQGLRARFKLVDGHETHRHVEGVKGLRRAEVLIGPLHARHPPGDARAVAQIGVLPLFGHRRRVQIDGAVRRHVLARLAQVLGQHGAEKHQRASAVRHGVEHLQRDAVAVVEEAHQPAVVLAEADGPAGVGAVRLHEGAARAVGLEIIPEEAPPYAHGEAGEARHGPVHSPLQRVRPYLLPQPGGEAVDGRVLLALDGRVHHARVVHAVPGRPGNCHFASLLPLLSYHRQAPFSKCAARQRLRGMDQNASYEHK